MSDVSTPRPDEPPRVPDHRTGSVDGGNRNRNAQSTRRVHPSTGAMCQAPFHSTPGFSRRFVSPGTLCVLWLSARRATRCRANRCRPRGDGGVGGAVGERAGASHGCNGCMEWLPWSGPLQLRGAPPLSRRLAQTRGLRWACGPVWPLWVKMSRRTPVLEPKCRHGP